MHDERYEPLVQPEDDELAMPYKEEEMSSSECMYTSSEDSKAQEMSEEQKNSMPEVRNENVSPDALPQSMPLEANEQTRSLSASCLSALYLWVCFWVTIVSFFISLLNDR